ncbi:UDP-N-acetylmuramoyl-tripeptide--D-alanyl-D-alanine ligase [Thauera linaloolentis]|uniref:UDP-N-acetylmuramoyl-tripeptide--D-alanyl-D-alanine ligase n=1 Tax=Thauera linaloolentis (strain DSM 12138 / JCM 21573 / CCUG 41526 / CIP 105981 / IAM 15112 / NBRC 102519 / 47Lol) TaxID=1123367 RepID=N6Z0N5_THAL4|nr:UDP-N-acetylmuramoyl-tripeptide--D-alanyl-D-alanine ligase [Thauera linaloolentis]ENO85739.1 UDP-N-acetylmuramoyl-tripeptide--D-alanyl-D-alanine ligase [Thauera linaloolentis 47Lol = DSM 12138]MCM8564179.1 UDP-N-acetylmuramoyl-tripeptide--D-alanyl-D-alanine ligase [Thauera linaloolentis]
MMNLQDAVRALATHDAHAIGAVRFGSVGTDSRALAPGQLFVALRGERFDGHHFVAAAAEAGAAAALVDARWFADNPAPALPVVVVDDTRLALGTLAAAWRARFALPLIGVTGSNGKTTVKEMCAAILRAQARRDGFGDESVLATRGNLNNDIGMPLTLLELRDFHRAAVVEMGMNRPGEIAYLAALAQPTVAVVNNAQRAHLQGMGTLDEVAQEKGAIYTGLGSAGVAVVNADDLHAGDWRGLNAGRRIVTFGIDQAADVRGRGTLRGLGSRVELETPQGRIEFTLQVPGAHNVRNALAAAAACLAAGAAPDAVAEGLAQFAGTRGRLQRRDGLKGALILDDSYNANPDSVRAAIDVLAAMPGHTWLVLGDMGEVGETSAQVHDEIGGYAKSKGIDGLFALGEMTAVAARNFGEGGHHFGSPEALVRALSARLDTDSVVLVKGSRFMRMERVADALAAVHNPAPSNGTGS